MPHWRNTLGSDQVQQKEFLGHEPEFFFAPSQMAKRGKEWGRDVFNERINTALSLFLDDSTRWLTIEHSHGAEALEPMFTMQLVEWARAPRSRTHSFSLTLPKEQHHGTKQTCIRKS